MAVLIQPALIHFLCSFTGDSSLGWSLRVLEAKANKIRVRPTLVTPAFALMGLNIRNQAARIVPFWSFYSNINNPGTYLYPMFSIGQNQGHVQEGLTLANVSKNARFAYWTRGRSCHVDKRWTFSNTSRQVATSENHYLFILIIITLSTPLVKSLLFKIQIWAICIACAINLHWCNFL